MAGSAKVFCVRVVLVMKRVVTGRRRHAEPPPGSRRRRRATLLAVTCTAAAAAVATPASANTYFVSGQQIVIDQTTGTAAMHGGLIGIWTYTSEPTFLSDYPLYHYTGTEHFEGCLNRHRDLSCRHDPRGTLTFSYDAWASYSAPSEAGFSWGACVHPVTSGTGAFSGAQGVITMIDTPTPSGVLTRYDGNIVLPNTAASAGVPPAVEGLFARSAAAPLARALDAPRLGCGTG